MAAAAGLTVLLIGALVAHLRHGDPRRRPRQLSSSASLQSLRWYSRSEN
ncbi:DoxX family protein [Williamsia sp. R60]